MSNFTLIGKRNGMMGIRMKRIFVSHEILRIKACIIERPLHIMDVNTLLFNDKYSVYIQWRKMLE